MSNPLETHQLAEKLLEKIGGIENKKNHEISVGVRTESSSNLLKHCEWHPTSDIYLLETYHAPLEGEYHLRIYLNSLTGYKDQVFIPSLVVGSAQKIAKMAKQDQQTIHQVLPSSSVVLDHSKIQTNWLFDNWIKQTNQSVYELWYYIRPCSFVMNELTDIKTDESTARIKLYTNRVKSILSQEDQSSTDWLVHLSSLDELSALWQSTVAYYIIALTNSPQYQKQHPRWQWSKIATNGLEK